MFYMKQKTTLCRRVDVLRVNLMWNRENSVFLIYFKTLPRFPEKKRKIPELYGNIIHNAIKFSIPYMTAKKTKV